MDVCNEEEWFYIEKINKNLFLITEPYFFEGNRCNIWLIKGGLKDLIIDCGLGVCNLRKFLEGKQLIDAIDKPKARPCIVVCTHVHFDHSGGAVDFEHVLIHEEEVSSLKSANSLYTLNWVKSEHFYKKPYSKFDVLKYKVNATNCGPIQDGEKLMIGEEEFVQILHLPGHSKGSIALYYPLGRSIFVGDIVYECGHGSGFLDWLPSSSVNTYIDSCVRLKEFLQDSSSNVDVVYPGHFSVLTPSRAQELLSQYIHEKEKLSSRVFSKCLKLCSTTYFKCC